MAEFFQQPLSPAALSWLALLGLPLVLVSATSFLKIHVVVSALRDAMGGDFLSPLVTSALSLVLSVVAMAPLTQALARQLASGQGASEQREAPSAAQVWALGSPLLASFFEKHSDEAERDLFVQMARERQLSPSETDLQVLWPAFVLTELKEALIMALLLLLPFSILDIVVANLLLSVGLTTLRPAAVTLPLKLLLFVQVGGFGLLVQALVGGYT